MQAELECNLTIIESRLSLALEMTDQMERDLFSLKKELQISLILTSSTKKLSIITSQSNYNRKELAVWTLLLPTASTTKMYVFHIIYYVFIVVEMTI